MATTNKSLNTPTNGQYVNTWDVPTNANFSIIDYGFGGSSTITVTGASGTVVLTAPTINGSTGALTSIGQYANPILIFSGTLTANVTYQLPTGIGGTWSTYNASSGAFTITVSSAGGGTSVVLPQGYTTTILCDGTNVRQSSTAASVLATSALRLLGSTTGYSGLQSPATGSNVTWTLPASDGSSGQYLQTNGAGVLSFQTVTSGVSSFQTSLSGLTPSTATLGAITLAGTLGAASGGTGATTLTGYVYGNGTSAMTASTTIPGTAISGNISGNAAGLTSTLGVSAGGTGATTLTGYLLGSGTSAITASATIPGTAISGNISGNAANVTGTVAVSNGGTGATTLTGYLLGSGTSAITASATIPGTAVSGNISGNAANITGTYGGTITSSQVTTALGYTPPQPTGTGASGTWGINITGNSGTATTATTATTAGTANALNTGNGYQVLGLGVNTAASGTGNILATGNITAYYSDERLKTRLGPIHNPLEKLQKLNGFYYEANKTAQDMGYAVVREVGVSAQEVQAVMPEIVAPAPIDDRYLTIRYERLVPLLIEAIKELADEVTLLREQVRAAK